MKNHPIIDSEMDQGTLKLRKLRAGDKASFLRAVEEFKINEPDWEFAFHFDCTMVFSDYIRRLDHWSKGRGLPEKFVPNTFLVAVVKNSIIGRVSIRHELNEYLARIGGHIGYGVIPSQRKRGYACEMLKLSLPVAASLGITQLLVTCDDDNIGSQRVIEANGGVLESLVNHSESKIPKRRYWINVQEQVYLSE